MFKLVAHDSSTGSGQASDWMLVRDGTHKLTRQFKFKNFKEAISFINKLANLAEREQHHPDIKIVYNRVQLELFTHAVGGLSENDFIMAVKINKLKTNV
ncbi:MAG: 4a-hydroxytetrahydrobiopterin dehydratase [Candidatus Levybacteria bacterium]|nr:4a-hydroxytetrahydrobiopterin dehydratase [Candidatus Levybacteria bacterium]